MTLILTGAAVVLPDRIIDPGSLVIEGERIVDVVPGGRTSDPHALDLTGHFLLPGFIDLHVHGVDGHDVMEDEHGVQAVARALVAHGVTSFCPTTIACTPVELGTMLGAVRAARLTRPASGARVLPAHLETNFLNPAYRGAQPAECLRHPPAPGCPSDSTPGPATESGRSGAGRDFPAHQVVDEIERRAAEVGIVTIAPELPHALDLIERFVTIGIRVSLGHSGATYEEGEAAITAGARHATHLFNRMPPLHHREPGLAGAVLSSDAVTAELICDGCHLHPAVVRMAAARRPGSAVAISDGTAVAGLPEGSAGRLGPRRIRVRDGAARLDDGTLAGSAIALDSALRFLIQDAGFGLVEAAAMCATTPARAMGLDAQGILERGAVADLVVLDRRLRVVRTYVGGRLVWISDFRFQISD